MIPVTCKVLCESAISFLLYCAIFAIVVVWFFCSSLISSDIICTGDGSQLQVRRFLITEHIRPDLKLAVSYSIGIFRSHWKIG